MKANLKTFIVVISLFLLTGIFVQDLLAQPPDRNHRRERLESIVIGKFVTELELTPEQSERFFPLFRQFRDQSEQVQRRQHQAREELDRLSQPTRKSSGRRATAKSENPMINNLAAPSEGGRSVDELINERERNEQEMLRLRSQFLKDVGGFLTPQQVSRCSIMLEEMPRKIHQMIQQEKRRQHNSGRGHRRPR